MLLSSNGKPGHSTISSSFGDKNTINGSVSREREDAGEGERIGNNNNNGVQGNYYADNYVVPDPTVRGRYVYSQDVRDSPVPTRNHYEKESKEDRKYAPPPAPEKERFR